MDSDIWFWLRSLGAILDNHMHRQCFMPVLPPDTQPLIVPDINAYAIFELLGPFPSLLDSHQEALAMNTQFHHAHPSQVFELYTDRSLDLITTVHDHIAMGGACFNATTQVETTINTTHFPSSTRAELLAILSGVLTLPFGSRVSIYTDSQAAIDGLNRFLAYGRRDVRRESKDNNIDLKISIGKGIIDRQLDIAWVKVVGHSGIEGNEKADSLVNDSLARASVHNTI